MTIFLLAIWVHKKTEPREAYW